MIPIGDDPYPRGGLPIVNLLIIAANIVVFLFLQLPSDAFTMAYAAIPKEVLAGHWTTLFTSTFLHGGWAHLLGNMLFLFIFGDNVEEAFGSFFYLLFYLVVGLAGSLAFVLTNADSIVPSLGASGAISGVLAAYLVLFPSNRVQVVAFLGWFPFRFAVPAVVMIGLWAALQFVNGFASIAATHETSGVAYMAHVGGFIAGFLITLAMKPFARPPQRMYRFGGY